MSAVSSELLPGAYVELTQLLALRHASHALIDIAVTNISSRSGMRLSRLRGRGVDFAEVREYQPGDDVRAIDWRVTARKNKPHTKVFREERERPTLMLVDQSQSMFFGSRVRLKSVAGAQVAALAAWHALANNDRVGGLIIGNKGYAVHKPYRSVKAVARFLADIATYNQSLSREPPMQDEPHINEALKRLHRLAPNNHRIYIISDFQPMGWQWQEQLRGLARHNEVIAVRIFDPLEAQLPPPGRYSVTDGKSRWLFDSHNTSQRQRYAARFADNETQLRDDLAHYGIRYLTMATDSPMSRFAQVA